MNPTQKKKMKKKKELEKFHNLLQKFFVFVLVLVLVAVLNLVVDHFHFE